MLHKKHDKYSDNGKYGPNNSNNRPTREPGVTHGPAGGECLLLPVPRVSRSSQSRFRHSRGMKSGPSSRSRAKLYRRWRLDVRKFAFDLCRFCMKRRSRFLQQYCELSMRSAAAPS